MTDVSSVVYFDFIGTLARFEGPQLRVAPEAHPLVAGSLRRGVLANFGPRLARADLIRMLDEAGLRDAFDSELLFAAEQMGFALPDPRAFAMAAAAAGCAPARCVFVSADPVLRIAAAAAGWSTVGVSPLPRHESTLENAAAEGTGLTTFFDSAPGELTAKSVRYALRGRVVTMNHAGDVLEDGVVLIEDGRIAQVLPAAAPRPQRFSGAPEVPSGGTIYPGLIDLHNHFVYNVLPLWVVPRRYDNRSQWPRHREYRSGVSMPIRQALGRFTVSSEAIVRYVEAKALLGGTTTGQGILTRIDGGASLFQGVMRNVERPSSNRLPAARTRVPDLTVAGRGGAARVASFRRSLAAVQENGGAYFYHLAEGIDTSARQHFFNLLDNDLLQPGLVGIHALGLKRADLDVLAERGTRIVWSPFSNQLLYGRTLNLEDVVASGVEMSLGCDWSPSGSKNLLQELKVASFVNRAQGGPLTSRRLVELVTSEAALVTGWHHAVGVIKPNAEADLLVIAEASGDPYDHLVAATEPDIRLVTVGGQACYGDAQLVARLHGGPATDLESIDVAGHTKAFALRTPGSPLSHLTFESARSILLEAMDDLPEFVRQQEAAEVKLLSMGYSCPQRFVLDFDNEFEPEDDPLLDLDVGDAEAELLAPVEMQRRITLDNYVLDPDDEDYWERIERQENIPEGLATHLRTAYGLQ